MQFSDMDKMKKMMYIIIRKRQEGGQTSYNRIREAATVQGGGSSEQSLNGVEGESGRLL